MTTTTTTDSVRVLPLEPASTVEVFLVSSSVRVRGTDAAQLVIRTRDGEALDDEVVIDVTPGRVGIRDAEGGLRLGPFRLRPHRTANLDLEVPRGTRLTIRTLSGDLEATGIRGASRWTTASGDLRLTASLLDGLDLATTSGDVRVEGELRSGGKHAIASVSGDVDLATPSPIRVETRTIAGDVHVTGPHRTEGGRGRRIVVVGAGSIPVEIRTTSGDIGVRWLAGGSIPMPPPAAPEPPVAPELGAEPAVDRREAERLEILRALERGEVDIETASHRLEILEGAGPRSFRGWC
ncbi:MAG: DUF4097 family beta strand repeat-containing protein [Candidatus Limnocylindrales bacterium]